jgi:hypothetical protein
MTVPAMPQQSRTRVLLYGAVYMDDGETLQSARDQIDAIVGSQDTTITEEKDFAIDIVATPAQIRRGTAQEWGTKLLEYCIRANPTIDKRFVGITDDEDRRVCRDLLVTGRLCPGDVDGVHLIWCSVPTTT